MKTSSNKENVRSDFFVFYVRFLTRNDTKVNKGKFETYQHTCHFLDKICPLHCHHHIKSGRKFFSEENPASG